MLDIVITHYKEPWSVCKRIFQTLDAQLGVDWNQIYVTVVNDGGEMLPEEQLEDLNFRCVQLNIPHGGVSAARNAGLDHAEEPWVMFCDCDDCLSNVFALADILNVLQSPAEQKYDMMWTNVWAQKPDGLVYQIPEKKIMVFIHGKIYRREFLLAQGIRFDESLSFNEDGCFNATTMARTVNTRIGEVRTFAPAYVWVRREDSVTSAEDAADKSAIGQFHRNLIVTEEIRRHKPEEYAGMVTRTVYDTYFMAHTRKFSDSCKQEILKEFRVWISSMGRADEFGKVKQDILEKIRAISRQELTVKGDVIRANVGSVISWISEVMQT